MRAKPDELLALHGVTAEMFAILRDWFDVPKSVTIDLAEVDSAVRELGDPVMVVAMAMRKLQALHLLSTPGVLTTTDVVVSIIGDLDRALIQAPNMYLKRVAESTDWDAELAELENPDDRGSHPSSAHPEMTSVEDADALIEYFRSLHAALHEAAAAVIEASDGEIRYFS